MAAKQRIGPIDARDVHAGAVTFVQRFGDALDLNPHFHSLVLDGAYVVRHGRVEGFVRVDAPTDDEVAEVTRTVASRVVKTLRRRGKLEDDAVAPVDDDGSVLLPCMLASVGRVAAVGDGAGRMLRRPGRRQVAPVRRAKRRCADVDGFSLHADVCVPANDRAQLERLCRYVARPAIASNGEALYELGLRNNDIPQTLNGMPLENVTDGFDAWYALWHAGEDQYTLVVKRGSSNITLYYQLFYTFG
jgi:hypothetical protein